MEHLLIIIVTWSLFLFKSEALLGRCGSGGVLVEQVVTPVIHGEGPHWDHRRQVLYYVDISNQTVVRYDPKTKLSSMVFIEGGPVSPVIPTQKDGNFIIGRGRDLVRFSWNGESSRGPLHILATVDNDKPKNRFNDGKADASGRLWIGTMGPEDPDLKLYQGSLFSFTSYKKFSPVKHLSGVSVSNGLGWSKNDTLMFYIDSPTRNIDVFDFDLQRGILRNRRTVFSFDQFGIPGVPDGMTVDNDDRLWIAVYHGARVIHVDPSNGTLLRTINLPASQVTSCAFGGPSLSVLYVTTSQRGLEANKEPQAGSLFALYGLGARGQRKTNIAKVY